MTDNEKKLRTLEEMTKESFEKRPSQAIEAIEEYILNLKEDDEERAIALESRLKIDSKYLHQFKVAMTHTPIMVFLISIKSSGREEIEIDLDQYVREFLFFSRDDDKEIYSMKLFYLVGLNATELQRKEDGKPVEYTQEQKDEFIKYDQMLSSLTKKYSESKLYLA